MGICDFSKDPGLVWDRPRGSIFLRSSASFRSIVAGLIDISRSAWSSVMVEFLVTTKHRDQGR